MEGTEGKAAARRGRTVCVIMREEGGAQEPKEAPYLLVFGTKHLSTVTAGHSSCSLELAQALLNLGTSP